MPDGSRYCGECGFPVGAATSASGPRTFWAEPLVIAAILLAVAALVLGLAVGWEWALIALLVAAVAMLVRTQLDQRSARRALAVLRIRAAATREAMAARSREQVELFRARRELAELEADRNRLFRDLGYAVYVEDETGIKAARTALHSVIERIAAKEAEIETLRRQTEERVQHARAEARPTERLETPFTEPARVPEPWPPPDEGDLPGPPTPSPGEPTPGPEEPAPPQHPPAPQTGRAEL